MFRKKNTLPQHLRQSVLADVLPQDELWELDQVGTVIDVSQGRRIIAESTAGRECFVVVDGEFTVQGRHVHTAIGGGDIAGELALLTGRRRNASVTASSDAAVYALHPREFATLLSTAPTFRARVVRSATTRLGTDHVTLPAQFVRRSGSTIESRDVWSSRLGAMPPWSPEET